MDLIRHLQDRLLFAVPKKGRLQQATLDLLSGSDIQFRREARLDIALVKNLPIALIFLPAADIPTFVGEGRVDLGITGRDQVAEHDVNLPSSEPSTLEEIMDLGFGSCKLQVQVPEKGAIQDPKDLVGKNIVTSFTGLTEDYFAKFEGYENRRVSINGAESPLPRIKTKIKFVGGSVEAACALGVADGIVDLVESGETMKAAGLKAIDTVVESTAVLIKSKRTSNEKLVNLITARIKGVISEYWMGCSLLYKLTYCAAAQKYMFCQYNVPRSLLAQATKITPGKRAPTITALDEPDWVAVSVMVEKKKLANAMDDLAAVGAEDILASQIANSRSG